MAAMRRVKAEVGWAVVCREEADVDPTGDSLPLVKGRLRDDRDTPVLARINEGNHRHGVLAGIELVHTGLGTPTSIARSTSR